MTLDNIQRYKYGGLAAAVLEEDPAISIGSLEQLASDLGIEDSAAGFIEGARATEQGIKTASAVYGRKYREAVEDTALNELYSFYENEFIKGYIGDVKSNKLKDEINKFSGAKFADIKKNIEKAKYILDGEKKGVAHNPAEINNSKDILKKYEKVISILSIAEKDYFERLRPKASERVYKSAFDELATKI